MADPGLVTRKVVIDAGAAIKMQRLERFGGELYTTSGVLREVKDEKARALLRTLPEEIRVREAVPKDLVYSREFAKATGDLGFLSNNDLELIALTVGIHREAGGTLRDRPALLEALEGNARFDWAPAKLGEAKHVEEKSEHASADASADIPAEDDGWQQAPQRKRRGGGARAQAPPAPPGPAPAAIIEQPAPAPTPEEAIIEQPAPAPKKADAASASADEACEDGVAAEAMGSTHDEDDSDVDSSDAGEWVTSDNMHRFGLGVTEDDSREELTVTCATSDYSVQNVLLQMGITPLTFDGYAVRSVKLWGLICRACCHFTRDTQKVFCPKCGNDTVVRVPIIVGEDGSPKILDNGRKLRTKGTIYSVPKPQGGRAFKPIFSEDEIRIGARDRDLRRAQKVYEKERECRDPFNEDNGARQWHQRNTTGSGRQINVNAPRMQAGYGRVNPNAGNFKGFKGRNKK